MELPLSDALRSKTYKVFILLLNYRSKKAFYFKTIRDKVLLDLHKIKHNRNYAARCPLSYTSLPL